MNKLSKNILLVDDNYLARMMIGAIIAELRPQWTVTEAENASEAMQRINASGIGFDAILIDFGIPGMNGLELAAKIRESGIAAPIAMVTANIQKPVRDKAKSLGAAFIEKPLKAEDLLEFFLMMDTQPPMNNNNN